MKWFFDELMAKGGHWESGIGFALVLAFVTLTLFVAARNGSRR